jgi:ABC-type antimicrobial peptide transport system permease subunit
MYGKPDPVIFFCVNTPDASNMYVRLEPNADVGAAVKEIGAVLAKDNPSYPFTYHFVDDEFNRFFQNEQLIGKISRLFAGLAILISCLGLFGLAAYTAERRTKEMGIRKILGASVLGVAALLSKDFLKLVVLSCIVAFPVAWWVMHGWLQQYKYRIEISWWTFLAAGLSAVLIALITISFQSTKAAMTNPAKNLRIE